MTNLPQLIESAFESLKRCNSTQKMERLLKQVPCGVVFERDSFDDTRGCYLEALNGLSARVSDSGEEGALDRIRIDANHRAANILPRKLTGYEGPANLRWAERIYGKRKQKTTAKSAAATPARTDPFVGIPNNAIPGKPLNGLSVVFTGKMSGSRAQMESQAGQYGAWTSDRVTTGTDLLVTGSRVGKVKTDAARDKGVSVITESEYYQLIQRRS